MRKKFQMVFCILIGVIALAALYIQASDLTESLPVPAGVIPIQQEFTTAYLIPVPQGYLLFDTGYQKEFGLFLKILKKNKIDPAMIQYILLSHHHDDHVGYISNLCILNPSLKLMVHEKTVPLLASGRNNQTNGGGIVNPVINGLYRFKRLITPDWDHTFPSFAVRSQDIVLKGEINSLPAEVGIKGVIIHTPGHSSDSISLVYQDSLLCGDMASYFLNWAGAKHLTLFNENLKDVYQSWEKVLGMDIKVILPAHGKPFAKELLKKNLNSYRQENLVKLD